MAVGIAHDDAVQVDGVQRQFGRTVVAAADRRRRRAAHGLAEHVDTQIERQVDGLKFEVGREVLGGAGQREAVGMQGAGMGVVGHHGTPANGGANATL